MLASSYCENNLQTEHIFNYRYFSEMFYHMLAALFSVYHILRTINGLLPLVPKHLAMKAYSGYGGKTPQIINPSTR
jgi:hypothetical protein